MTDLAPAGPYQPGTRIDLDPVPLAVVRHAGVTLDGLRDLFDRGYGALGGVIAAGGIVPVGPALAIYRGDPAGRFDLEIGFPVVDALTSPIAADVEVVGATLPAGPALAATHLGPYDDLGAAWGRLFESAASAGTTPSGTWIEVYVVDPGTDPDHLRTDLLLLVTT